MAENKLTLKKMEAKTGIDHRMLSLYTNRHRLPSLKNAYRIYIGSGKKVKLEDWFVQSESEKSKESDSTGNEGF